MPPALPRPAFTAEAIAARNELVTKNLGLVHHAIKQMLGTNPENKLARRVGGMEDLFQYGVCGLISAAEKYNPAFRKGGKGIQFSTYAMKAIKRRLQLALTEGGIIRIPQCAEQSRRCAEFARRARKVAMFSALDPAAGPIDDYLGLYGPETRDVPEEAEQVVLLRRRVTTALSQLTEQQRVVLDLLYWRGLNLGEAGVEMGVSKERVRQVRNEGLKKLKRLLGNHYE